MQQTNKYKFNLIETSDPFSPEKLNDNARAVEAELAALADATATADAALAQTIDAVEKGANLFHLAGPVAENSFTTITIDLSGIDMSQYRMLIAFVMTSGTAGSYVTAGSIVTSFNGSIGNGMLRLYRVDGLVCMNTNYVASNSGVGHRGAQAEMEWDSINSLEFRQAKFVDLYGIKA